MVQVSDRYFRLDQRLADGGVSLRIDRPDGRQCAPAIHFDILPNRLVPKLRTPPLICRYDNMHLNAMSLIFI